MKEMLQYIKKQVFRSSITSCYRKKITLENHNLQAITKIKRNIVMPLKFDFVTYYDDIELENNFIVISTDNSLEDSTASMVDTADQNVDELNCLMLSPHLRSC